MTVFVQMFDFQQTAEIFIKKELNSITSNFLLKEYCNFPKLLRVYCNLSK